MNEKRIRNHPILPYPPSQQVTFYWQGEKFNAYAHETIASALIANGIHVFGHHHKDHAPQGIFCANGQCAQCTVLVNGIPEKSCMELVRDGIRVEPLDGIPSLSPLHDHRLLLSPPEEIDIPVLIIGGGPAGLSAAIQLGQLGIRTILVDDKHQLGGKLVLQTHRFFGSKQEVYAGTRGIDIAKILSNQLDKYPSVEVHLSTRAVGVFSDKKVGVIDANHHYRLITPEILLVTTGARENFLTFKGNTLPGVFGAGAFQTLVNRDLVRPSKKLMIIGGGNVGLISGYHAIQAGIQVVGLIEALPECGGYLVHKDKLSRLGVPIYTSHTILEAIGTDHVKSVVFAKIDESFRPIRGTEMCVDCDTILIAVGLNPVDEFYRKAQEFNMKVYAAGDAEEIAEASAAMISGKIKGLKIARDLNLIHHLDTDDLEQIAERLRARPGAVRHHALPEITGGVRPIIHCAQEIPCNPCSASCPIHKIQISEDNILQVPLYTGDEHTCLNCERCLVNCPGLAITIVDARESPEHPFVSLPFELNEDQIDSSITLTDVNGLPLYDSSVFEIHSPKNRSFTKTLKVQVPKELATHVSGFVVQKTQSVPAAISGYEYIADDAIVCRCERVTAGEIRALIRQGIHDINQLKAITRAGMGACGSKTCGVLINRLFREEGIPLEEITQEQSRPLFFEIPLEYFAGTKPEL